AIGHTTAMLFPGSGCRNNSVFRAIPEHYDIINGVLVHELVAHFRAPQGCGENQRNNGRPQPEDSDVMKVVLPNAVYDSRTLPNQEPADSFLCGCTDIAEETNETHGSAGRFLRGYIRREQSAERSDESVDGKTVDQECGGQQKRMSGWD